MEIKEKYTLNYHQSSKLSLVTTHLEECKEIIEYIRFDTGNIDEDADNELQELYDIICKGLDKLL